MNALDTIESSINSLGNENRALREQVHQLHHALGERRCTPMPQLSVSECAARADLHAQSLCLACRAYASVAAMHEAQAAGMARAVERITEPTHADG